MEKVRANARRRAVMVDYLAFGLIVWAAPESGYLPARHWPTCRRLLCRCQGAGTHGAAALAVTGPPLSRWDSALCLPLRVVLVEGRDEGKPGGLHDIPGRRPDRNPAARQLHLELDLSDRLAARAD